MHLHTQCHLQMHITKAPSSTVHNGQTCTINNLRWWTPCTIHTVPAHLNNLRWKEDLELESQRTSTSGLGIVSRVDVRVEVTIARNFVRDGAPSRETTNVSAGYPRVNVRVRRHLHERRRTSTWIPVSPTLVKPSDIECRIEVEA